MIIDAISDLHGCKPALHGGDLLIVAGDLTARDTDDEYLKVFDWMYGFLRYKKIIFIAGNHDNLVQEDTNFFRRSNANLIAESFDKSRAKKVEYLCDSGTEFEGLKIYGSPWTSQFPGINPKCCAFTRPFMHTLEDKWNLIPDDVDILITHSPPYGVLDQVVTEFGASVGDMNLLKTLEERIRPRLHVFGHIHENGGKQLIFKRPGYGDENNTICVNASHVNEYYRPVNKPVRIILEETKAHQVEESEKG